MNDTKEIIFLSSAKIGKTYTVLGFNKSVAFYEKERLLSYGFIVDSIIKVVRKSIFRTTMQITLKDCNLIIRSKDANKIIIQEI